MADPSSSEKPPASSSSSASKLGACFFHLLDWNRKHNAKRHKLLPENRPSNKQSPKKVPKDEKLPMAKLLLIAEENRGGFPKSGELFSKERTPEKNKKQPQPKKKSGKRSPSVVAKLMGLETMPSPEPPRKDKKRTEEIRTNDENTNPNLPLRARPYDSDNDINSLAITCQKTSVEEPKLMFFYKLPSLSPRKIDGPLRSILSPSKAHNKLISPIKSPIGTKRLFEAAAKMLEPNMQPSTRVRRNMNLGSHVSRSMLTNGNLEEEKSCSSARTSRIAPRKPSLSSSTRTQQAITSRLYPDQSNAQVQTRQKHDKGKIVSLSNSNASTTRLQAGGNNIRRGSTTSVPLNSNQEAIVSRSKSGSFKEEATTNSSSYSSQRLFRSRSAKDNANHGKNSQNDVKASREDKPKPEVRKQPRLSQSTASASVKRKGMVSSKQESAESTAVCNKSAEHNELGTSIVSSNNGNESNDSVGTSMKPNSVNAGNSSILHYSRLFGSKRTSGATKVTKKKGDSLMKSLLRKRVGLSSDRTQKPESGKTGSKNSKDLIDEDDDVLTPLPCQEDSSSSGECITTEMTSNDVEDSISESSSSVYSSLEVKRANKESPGIIKHSRSLSKSSYYEASNVTTMKQKFNTTTSENSVNSSCLSSVGECGDTASSTLEPDLKKAVSYSGKTTAAILQELLAALNSSKAQISSVDKLQNLSNNHDSISSTSGGVLTCLESAGSYTASQDIDDSACSDEIQRPRKRLSGVIDDWKHRSPVSTLDPPYDDDSFSDSFDSTHERGSLRTLHTNQPDVVSRRHNINFASIGLNTVKKPYKEAYECEEQYVKEIMGATKLTPVDIYAAMLEPSSSLLDLTIFKSLEEQFHEQWEWGVKPEDCLESDSTLLNDSEQCGAHNRKLIFDCVNEAYGLDVGIDGRQSLQCFPQIPDVPLHYRSLSVCRQINAWKDMACNMNVDDIVEKEMNAGSGKWVDFGYEVSELAVETETTIINWLLNELVVDLNRSSK